MNLPLARSLPTYNLTPDTSTPSVAEVFNLSNYKADQASSPDVKPSMLRRAGRQVRAHYSLVTPLPTEFPYGVPPLLVEELKKDLPEGQEELKVDLEDMLARMEPSLQHPVLQAKEGGLAAYSSPLREKTLSKAVLLGLSKKCAEDLLPNLDLGEEGSAAREEILQILSGRAVLAKIDEDKTQAFSPWSLCYGGHQFGSWASQLGDGRAVSVFTTHSTPTSKFHSPQIAELQLKGAGRTPYSRFADGLAVLRSSVREYLGSEYMAALAIPTSRALSLIHLPDVAVAREKMETGAVVCRVAPSWIRLGSFEIHRSRDDWRNLSQLVTYVSKEVLGVHEEKMLARELVKGVAKRTAVMIARWQAYGFMHGVMNTDNFSVLGLTIDYGPYAFMDKFDRMHICNHSDDSGRYAYKLQPAMGEFAIRKLGDAVAEMIGAEIESDSPLTESWADDSDRPKRMAWREKGLEYISEIAGEYKSDLKGEYEAHMAKRLGFLDCKPDDNLQYFEKLLDIMENYNLDFSRTFRTLCFFPGVHSTDFKDFLTRLIPLDEVPKHHQATAQEETTAFLRKYEERLAASESANGTDASSRQKRMKAVNPRFILRQWVLEEAIARLEDKRDTAFLELVLQMSTNPFESYGEDGESTSAEEARLCGIGSENMLGFQCSCSS